MYLRKIELIGFKSFANRTVLPFGEGITAVVGPNGSGKSNIVDAIRWVLGEQRMKSLRASESADVIFSGNERRKATSMAQVNLVLDNRLGRFGASGEEITITRRLYRDGASEYLLNGKRVRLKDVRDLLFGTGLGVNEYSIIEQGKVDLLLQLSPSERRALFDEAAGILRYKERRNEARRRLAKVEENLVRLTDIVEEVERQRRSLQSQAARARRWFALRDTLEKARLDLFVVRYRALRTERDAAAERLTALEREYAAMLASFGELSAARERRNEELAALRRSYMEKRDELARAEGEIERLENERRWLGRRASEAEGRRKALERERSELDLTAERSREELAEMREELAAASREREEARARVAALEGEVGKTDPAYFSLKAELAALEREEEEKARLRAEKEKKAASLRGEMSVAAEKKEWYIKELGETAEKMRRLEESVAELDGNIASLAAALKETRRRAEELSSELAECDSELAALKEERDSLRAASTLAAERLARLEELEKALSAASEGEGGTLADALEVASGWELAAETLFGEFLSARLAREVPPSGNGSWAFPSESAVPRVFERMPGATPARELVSCSGPFRGAFYELTSGVFFVDELPPPERVPSGVTLIDRSGTLLTRSRCLRRAAETPPEERTLLRRAEMASLREEVKELEGRLADLEGKMEEREGRRRDLLRRSAELSRARRREEIGLQVKEERRSALRHEQGALRKKEAEIRARIAEAEERAADLARALEALEAEETDPRAPERAARISELKAELERMAAGRERLMSELNDARIAAARASEKAASLSDAVARIEKGLEGLAARKDRLAAEMLELERTAEKAAAEAEALEKTIAGKAAELERLRSESSSLSDRVTAAERALRSLATESSALEKRLDALRRDREDAKLALNSVEVRMAGLAESCMEALGIPLEQEAAERDVEQSEEELEKLVADSERKMKNLGNVNLEAVNLLQAVEERAAFLREQKRDLEASKRSLEEIIEDINRRCKSLFLDTFEKTRRNFNEIFRKLFGGGKADLSLEEGDVLEAGVNVVVRPPGKEPRQLSLLSGGEKALTALSLLLAMFRANPSPFCVLDEVDAPLDDTNVNRFVMLLREFSDRSQFILISHNKLTIEKADTVFGVTLDRDGVSRIISVELERVASLLGDGD